MPKFKKFSFYTLLFILLISLDFLLKRYVYCNIPLMGWQHPSYPFGGIGIIEGFFGFNFAICHVHNTGCAWGMFSQYPGILFLLRMVLILSLIIYFMFLNKEKAKSFSFFLIITGAIGNVIDFFLYEKVIDMFYFFHTSYSFPVFNLADAYISIGIGLVLFYPILQKFKAFEKKVGL